MKEIERKFLLNKEDAMNFISLTPSSLVRKLSIEQFYTQYTPLEIRFRRSEENGKRVYYKTVKTGFGISRDEEEEEISFTSFENNIRGTNNVVNKVRYIIDDLEFDFYPSGLAILEKEYPSIEEANSDIVDFKFIRKEVTGNKHYSNASIAKRRG